jgi:membrane-associated protease RseP (regulator of RpoE activity)
VFFYPLLGLVVLVLAAAASLAASFGGRRVAAKWLGFGQVRLFGIKPDDAYRASSLGRRALLHGAGPLASYLLVVALFAIAFMIGGDNVATTAVEVMDGPAKAAGMKDGDRLLRIGDAPVERWDSIRPPVMPRAGKATPISVERGGAEQTIVVTPDEQGRILVRPIMERRPYGFGAALGRAFVEPITIVSASLGRYLKTFTGVESELMGPVGIVKEASNTGERSIADKLFLFCLFGSYLWPVLLFVESILAFSAWRELARR